MDGFQEAEQDETSKSPTATSSSGPLILLCRVHNGRRGLTYKHFGRLAKHDKIMNGELNYRSTVIERFEAYSCSGLK